MLASWTGNANDAVMYRRDPQAVAVSYPVANDPFIEALRAGNPGAFATLVKNEMSRLIAVARKLLRSEQDAQDAVQDALLQAYRHIHQFEGRSSLRTWMYQITVRACLMARRRDRRRNGDVSLTARIDDDGLNLADTVASVEPAAEDMVATHEDYATVRRTMMELPASYREILELRDIEGLDVAQTAKRLQTTAGVVKTRLHRARNALREILKDRVDASSFEH